MLIHSQFYSSIGVHLCNALQRSSGQETKQAKKDRRLGMNIKSAPHSIKCAMPRAYKPGIAAVAAIDLETGLPLTAGRKSAKKQKVQLGRKSRKRK